jgi:RNA polymerase sigma-70 factor (ECF subfamily)
MTENDQIELYGYYDRIVAYLVHRFHFSDEEARDIAQDVFLRVLVREEKPISPWLFLKTAAHHRAVNVIRGEVAHRKVRGDSVDALPHLSEAFLRDFWSNSPPASPEAEASRNEEVNKLSAAIDELPASLRRCLLLRMDGLSYNEIAIAQQITVDAVRTRLRDAKRLLTGGE